MELKWNGTKLIDAETMLGWAKQMTWKGIHPIVALSHKMYQKGISLGKAAMQAVEARLKRDPNLPKYDILINPAPIDQPGTNILNKDILFQKSPNIVRAFPEIT